MPLIFDNFIYQLSRTVAGFRRTLHRTGAYQWVPVRTRPYLRRTRAYPCVVVLTRAYLKIIDLPTHQPKWLAVGNSIGPEYFTSVFYGNMSVYRLISISNTRVSYTSIPYLAY